MSVLDPSEVPAAAFETPASPISDLQVRRALVDVYVAFATTGFAFASWASRLPDVKNMLDLQPSELGRILLASALGSVLGLPIAGRIIERIGTRRTVENAARVFGLGLLVAALGVSVVGSVPMILVGMFVLGTGMGTWDVAMNHEGATVERHRGKATMPWFHAAFSLATVAGALVGSLMTGLRVPIWAHILLPLAFVVYVAFGGVRHFLPEIPAGPAADPGTTRGRSAWTEPRTLIVGFVVLVAAFAEGTANDWVAIAFTEGHHLPTWAGVLGMATFLTAMTIGRILGTGVLDKFGRVPVLISLFALALVGSVMVVFGNAAVAFGGAVLWGVGASLGFPVGMSAASDEPERAAARLSVVSTIGYLAFLGGPPLLGYLGDHVGILHALLVVGALVIPAMLAVPAVRPPRR